MYNDSESHPSDLAGYAGNEQTSAKTEKKNGIFHDRSLTGNPSVRQ